MADTGEGTFVRHYEHVTTEKGKRRAVPAAVLFEAGLSCAAAQNPLIEFIHPQEEKKRLGVG